MATNSSCDRALTPIRYRTVSSAEPSPNRKIHAPPVIFKGSGWYVTDYGKGRGNHGLNPDRPESKSSDGESSESSSTAGDSAKASDTKSEAKTASTTSSSE